MNDKQPRTDDFLTRRKHLETLTDSELKARFWELANQTVSPLLHLARTHTSPAIERSVLMRMGFSSIEAKALVDKVLLNQLIGKGAGHVVYRYAMLENISIRQAGLALLDDIGFLQVKQSFGVK